MDAQSGAVWFIFVDDHHEGPHAPEAILEFLRTGKLQADSYIWREGQADWQPLNQIEAFQAALGTPPPVPPANHPVVASAVQFSLEPSSASQLLGGAPQAPLADPTRQSSVTLETSLPAGSVEISRYIPAGQSTTTAGTPTQAGGTLPADHLGAWDELDRRQVSRRLLLKGGAIGLLLGVVIGGILGVSLAPSNDEASSPLRERLGGVLPFLHPKVPPLPPLPDLTPEEYHRLEGAAVATPAEKTAAAGHPIKFALSLSPTLGLPVFHLASTLPDHTKFYLYLIGHSETLLNQTSFSVRLEAQLERHYAKTLPIKMPEGKVLPKGEYQAYLSIFTDAPPELIPYIPLLPHAPEHIPFAVPAKQQILYVHTYFLGGPKDPAYTKRLEEYHDKLWERIEHEIAELKQYQATLNSQFKTTQANFEAAKNSHNPIVQKKEWLKHEDEWSQLQAALQKNFVQWTPQKLKTDYFYAPAFAAVQLACDRISALFQAQGHYINQAIHGHKHHPHPPPVVDLLKATAQVQAALQDLDAKLALINKVQRTPGAIPQKIAL